MGGPSSLWIKVLLDEESNALAGAAKVMTPVLLLQAGEDLFVLPEPQREFCARVPACRLLTFPGSYHEIFREVDNIRKPMLDAVFTHFDLAQPPAPATGR
jgi:lysophospholipase